jgi:methylated-DNA-[protein]-cysteine S-methyltransferase
MSARKFLKITPSPFGPFAIIWTNQNKPEILRVILSDPETAASEKVLRLFPGTHEAACRYVDRIAGQLQSILKGFPESFNLDAISLERCSQFQQKVLTAEHQIPRGYISTYGRIASNLKTPGAARAVGHALATNPFPVIIPCHRAVRSDLRIGGFQGGAAMKRRLLEMEGHEIDGRGRILKPKLYY